MTTVCPLINFTKRICELTTYNFLHTYVKPLYYVNYT